MAEFLSICTSISEQILKDYQWLVAILFTAGLSLLIYFKILRINNFLLYSQKYQENLKSFLFLEKINYKDGRITDKNSGKELDDQDVLDLPILFNLLSEVGLLYRKGLIDRGLVYKHFGNVVYSLCTQHAHIVNHIQGHTKTDNIGFLFRAFGKKGARGDRLLKVKIFLGKNIK